MTLILKRLAWIVTLTLTYMGMFIAVRFLTEDFPSWLILACIFTSSAISVYVFQERFSIPAMSVFLLTLLILFIDAGEQGSLLNWPIFVILVIGSVLGYVSKEGKNVLILSVFILGAGVIFTYNKYSFSMIDELRDSKVRTTSIEKFAKSLKNYQGEQLKFHEDTIYLVNFTAVYCAPCTIKKSSLEMLGKTFRNSPVKILQIHVYEDENYFTDSLLHSNYTYYYHDYSDSIFKTLARNGVPKEYLFNKKGIAVREIEGFQKEAKNDYEAKTKKLIKTLLNK